MATCVPDNIAEESWSQKARIAFSRIRNQIPRQLRAQYESDADKIQMEWQYIAYVAGLTNARWTSPFSWKYMTPVMKLSQKVADRWKTFRRRHYFGRAIGVVSKSIRQSSQNVRGLWESAVYRLGRKIHWRRERESLARFEQCKRERSAAKIGLPIVSDSAEQCCPICKSADKRVGAGCVTCRSYAQRSPDSDQRANRLRSIMRASK